MPNSRSKRVLIYSHDSFGLGHVSRCRTIANALVEADPNVSVLILSGSPDHRHLRVPLGHRLRAHPGRGQADRDGDYTRPTCGSASSRRWRCATRIIRDTADIYRSRPVHRRQGADSACAARSCRRCRLLKERGTPLVLGLRDVMDDPTALAAEWERKNVVPALRDLYDEIWIYGLPQINEPLTGIEVPPSVRHKMVYTGYLRRDLPLHSDVPHELEEIDEPFILVTAGGGGDGADLIDWVLRAYESDPHIPYRRGDRVRPVHVGRRARGLQGARRPSSRTSARSPSPTISAR